VYDDDDDDDDEKLVLFILKDRSVVTICTASLQHSGHYMYRQFTAEWSLYVPSVYSPVVALCATRFHIKTPRAAHTLYLCVLCGSEQQQAALPPPHALTALCRSFSTPDSRQVTLFLSPSGHKALRGMPPSPSTG
jgi:hypothetical protein